jgi:hypothetical protein
MVELHFYLSEEDFGKLADLRDQELNPELRGMTFNDYARGLLEAAIRTQYINSRLHRQIYKGVEV